MQATHRQANNLRAKHLQRAQWLCTRLYKFAMGMKGKSTDAEPIRMTGAQVRAAVAFIDRFIPQLKSQELHLHDHTERMSTKDLQTKLAELLQSQPELLKLAAETNPELKALFLPALEGEVVKKPH